MRGKKLDGLVTGWDWYATLVKGVAGLDPTDKYRQPITSSHEVGWRARTPAGLTGRPGLEIFGVCDHARSQVCGKFN